MRLLLVPALLTLVACGGDFEDAGGTGGVVAVIPGGSGGEATGGAGLGSDSSGGATLGTGGDIAGSGGETSSGGTAATGGDSGSGGAQGTGGSAAPSACNPPPLTNFVGVGMDQSNLCGWGHDGGPEGYASISVPIDCADPEGRIALDLVENGSVPWNPRVEIIDPSDRCSSGPQAGVDRRFTFPAGFCVKVTSPFEGFQIGLNPDPSGCVIADAGPIDVKVTESAWVKVETAAMSGDSCPLSCP